MNAVTAFLLALAIACLAFSLVYLLARRLNNYGIVDVAWSLGFAPVAMHYGFLGDGSLERRIFIAAIATIWSLRLGGYLAVRVLGKLNVEDARYRQLREDWGPAFGLKMFGFFHLQALLLVTLSLPFLIPAYNPEPGLRTLEIAAGGLWFIAVVGEALADLQLAAFKRDPGNRGRVCARGLWSWSRHPNYFFEWLAWVAFSLFALASPGGCAGLLSPALMLFFLLKVTGIKYTEAQLLRSKGEAYARYQQQTSPFVPLPPGVFRQTNPYAP